MRNVIIPIKSELNIPATFDFLRKNHYRCGGSSVVECPACGGKVALRD